ncbi:MULTISPECIES: DUF1310 family protein [Streptococcus]|nr:DUF1310 family protein [Streptococcus parauberis]AUT06573.1 hypothetical protein SPSF3K_01852 [Streptococcus parauberis]EGE53594.1 hypothetical protein SPB_1045 [Streptococcus parauberis NCFD 2020]EMG25416.1 hypothetical protein SPJ1_0827 [Streptococcus parauberis KRS-02083]KYP21141.1 hypothetical protein AKL13_00763 [Streptococcus parauberis]KYP21525.1 hypothetical protein TN39_00686 [Streptococcus parauberis]
MIAIAHSVEAKKVYDIKIEYENKEASANKINDFRIKKYSIDDKSLDYNPMGGLMISLIINDNSDLTIDFNLIDNGDGTYHSAYFALSEDLSKMLGY